jgi:hypothetical protein
VALRDTSDRRALSPLSTAGQLDWTRVSAEVVLVVLPWVLRELEGQGNIAGAPLRERAARVVSWLRNHIDAGAVRFAQEERAAALLRSGAGD